MTPPLDPWPRALLALRLLRVDPIGLGGLWLRARPGPARDLVTDALHQKRLPLVRLHPGLGDDALDGGTDLSATLAAGRMIPRAGLLAARSTFVLAMAERCPGAMAARLGQMLDRHGGAVIALDEGAEPEEVPPPALTDRLGLFLSLDGLPLAALSPPPDEDLAGAGARVEDLAGARARAAAVDLTPGDLAELASVAAALGIGSLRAPLFACAAARAHAALHGRTACAPEDLHRAVELTLAHRATVLPDDTADDAPQQAEEPPEPPDAEDPQKDSEASPEIPQDILLEAALAALPRNLLETLAAGRAARAAAGASGSGARHRGNRRGRPLPARPGKLDGRNRIDLVATLTAAAPWQALRREHAANGTQVQIRPSDIRVRRYQETSDRLLIFAVDASGSAAMARLAEAKGAVELLLAEAYSRRDHVALVAFRGEGAEVLLPPTRSLVQTKRRLAALPGGGGTPLAAGLGAALEMTLQARARGMTPTVALLTDGKANIALDGQANRARADHDARTMALALRRLGVPAVVIDTGRREQPPLRELAATLGAPYIPLPRADSRRLSQTLATALDG